MVRNKVDLCAFCEEAPCVCNTDTRSKKRAPKVQEKPSDSDKSDKSDIWDKGDKEDTPPKADRKKLFAEAMRAKAAQAPPPPPTISKPVRQHRAVNPEAAMFEAAVRALGPLLAPQEQEKYRAILTSEPTLEEQRLVWKARRDELTRSVSEDASGN